MGRTLPEGGSDGGSIDGQSMRQGIVCPDAPTRRVVLAADIGGLVISLMLAPMVPSRVTAVTSTAFAEIADPVAAPAWPAR